MDSGSYTDSSTFLFVAVYLHMMEALSGLLWGVLLCYIFLFTAMPILWCYVFLAVYAFVMLRPKKDGPDIVYKPYNSNKLEFRKDGSQCVVDEIEGDIPLVLRTHDAVKAAKQTVIKIYSWCKYWRENELSHSATFDTLVLDPEMKQNIIDDLDLFLKGEELYKKVGKPWRRSYLLYGPHGTGKSSLIAAMAKYLKFNVYDIQLTSMAHIKQAMREISTHSIIVFEDIDHKDDIFIMSSLLNYMDDLWKTCGGGRIIICTSHKGKIEPAMLRFNMHIHLSFLEAKTFRILLSIYLDIQDHHPLFEPIEVLLEKVKVTPAAVREQLSRNEDPDAALDELFKFLKEIDDIQGQTKMPVQAFGVCTSPDMLVA